MSSVVMSSVVKKWAEAEVDASSLQLLASFQFAPALKRFGELGQQVESTHGWHRGPTDEESRGIVAN